MCMKTKLMNVETLRDGLISAIETIYDLESFRWDRAFQDFEKKWRYMPQFLMNLFGISFDGRLALMDHTDYVRMQFDKGLIDSTLGQIADRRGEVEVGVEILACLRRNFVDL